MGDGDRIYTSHVIYQTSVPFQRAICKPLKQLPAMGPHSTAIKDR